MTMADLIYAAWQRACQSRTMQLATVQIIGAMIAVLTNQLTVKAGIILAAVGLLQIAQRQLSMSRQDAKDAEAKEEIARCQSQLKTASEEVQPCAPASSGTSH